MLTQSIVIQKVMGNPAFRLYKHYVIDSVMILKNFGPRELIRRRGRKFLIGVVSYYLIRDTIVYVLIPLCLAQRLF